MRARTTVCLFLSRCCFVVKPLCVSGVRVCACERDAPVMCPRVESFVLTVCDCRHICMPSINFVRTLLIVCVPWPCIACWTVMATSTVVLVTSWLP